MTDETAKAILNTILNYGSLTLVMIVTTAFILGGLGWAKRFTRRAWVGPESKQPAGPADPYEARNLLICGCETDPEGFLTYRRKGCRIGHLILPTERRITTGPGEPYSGDHVKLDLHGREVTMPAGRPPEGGTAVAGGWKPGRD